MSFIDLEFMGIQSPDIMADSVDTKQMLLTLNSKLAWLNSLTFRAIWPYTLVNPILNCINHAGFGFLYVYEALLGNYANIESQGHS